RRWRPPACPRTRRTNRPMTAGPSPRRGSPIRSTARTATSCPWPGAPAVSRPSRCSSSSPAGSSPRPSCLGAWPGRWARRSRCSTSPWHCRSRPWSTSPSRWPWDSTFLRESWEVASEMVALQSLFEGLAHALTPMNLLWVLVGCFLGTAVGVLPGLGSSMAVALLLPMTFALDPTGAFIMFAGVYFGGLFGDSTMAILMNTPGQDSAIASTIKGHKMAKDGGGRPALATAAPGAFMGGCISCFLVVSIAPALANLSTSFGPAEFFALALFAFVATSSVVADSVLKGLMALVLGIGFSVIGIDSVSGTERFTFGVPELFDGVSLVTVTVGILALGEVFFIASRIRRQAKDNTINSSGRPFLSRKEVGEALPAWLRGTAIGLPFGVIPVGGADVPTFMAYGLERKLDSRRSHPQFGKGA